MASNENIFNEIYNILNTAKQSGSLTYFKNILKGVRDFNIEIDNALPVIVLEPLRDIEDSATLPHRKKITFIINIFIVMKVYNFDEQITGGEGTKGILDMVEDVKNVLNANRTLNGKVIKFNFTDTSYSFEDYPIRQAVITMENEYIITDTGR